MAITLPEESTLLTEVTLSNQRPTVLVFDSGVGGLSVYDEIRQLLPGLHYLYVFDNEAFPYGEKSEAFIVDRVVKIVDAATRRYPLALVVIACNSASTVTLPALRQRFSFPVVGVVPAIKPAARLTRNGVVGLLATRGTVKRLYTHELVSRFAHECRTEMLGSAELVELAEAKLQGKVVPLEEIRQILQPWLRMSEPPDTVVLGCTHFPLLSEELQAVLPEGTRLIDSGAAIARRTAWLLANQAPDACSADASRAYCLRLDHQAEQLLPVLQRYGFETLEKLPLVPANA
ncbi:glutamate racemase [Erwinia sp. OLTSP20]|uniref:glutamate racemase n=1 Tax=unclassified Erwinia TaxID=2622719 RepID=UPI000C19924D|nr:MULTISPECIES: glutamate racemase [unclassified Erwinia]PIJ49927.1 glutamate racemase [Erwinia sp. OAMSP11]PIJ71451.1 glutamate racemase [Erwinia sp. OLSSP12]PIJ80886.1 glutamate racemase [Erwinia sp. OLCASP19]PIJ83365.1 glutamate racemase [Erwinia sp. OLMTSP26]PIJ85587.1 glutamate racemase [Erwinia sp. OLMDSP33]